MKVLLKNEKRKRFYYRFTKFYLCLSVFLCGFVFFSCAQNSESPRNAIGLAVPYEIDTLDPQAKSKLSSFAVLSNFYEPLVILARDMSIEPCLAESWENPDLLTWVFHLRKSVRFHSGKTMTVEDVVYSVQRVLKHSEFETAAYVSNVTEVGAIGEDSVRIRTRHPTAILLNKLSFIPIIPKGSTSEFLSHNEDGTGAYRLKFWDQQKNEIVLTRNENYWNKMPFIKDAVFYLALDDQQALQKLLSGEAQFFLGTSRKSEAAVKNNPRFLVERKDSFYVKYLGFNFQNESPNSCGLPLNRFHDLLLREAIHYGIDRFRLISSLSSYAFPVTQAVPPFTFGFDPSLPVPEYNPEKARRLLSDAGYPDGLEVTLLVRKVMEQAGVSVKEQLGKIGVRVHITDLSDSEFFPEVRQGRFCMFLSRFGSPTGDASDILESAFHTYEPAEYLGQLNYGRYSNPVLDKAIVESCEIQQLERRKEKLQEIMRLLSKETVWVPLYGDQDIYIHDSSFSWKPRMDSLIKIWEISHK